jgi:hypothetical protein
MDIGRFVILFSAFADIDTMIALASFVNAPGLLSTWPFVSLRPTGMKNAICHTPLPGSMQRRE